MKEVESNVLTIWQKKCNKQVIYGKVIVTLSHLLWQCVPNSTVCLQSVNIFTTTLLKTVHIIYH